MNHYPMLKEYFPNYITGVFFSKMSSAPWASIEGYGQALDFVYFGSYSGQKPASAIVRDNSVDGIANSQVLADVIWRMYSTSWTKLWEAIQSEYDPINNYSIKEIYEMIGDDNRVINKTQEDSSESKEESSGTDDTTSTNSQTNSTFAFNSQSAVPTATVSGTSSDNNINSSTVNNTSSSDSTEDTDDKLHRNENSTRTRIGNVGQNTYQELIRQEIDLWNWNLFMRLFEDADRFLVLSVYDNCMTVQLTRV